MKSRHRQSLSRRHPSPLLRHPNLRPWPQSLYLHPNRLLWQPDHTSTRQTRTCGRQASAGSCKTGRSREGRGQFHRVPSPPKGADEKQAAAEIIAEVQGIDINAATQLAGKMIVPVVKGVTEEDANKVRDRLKDAGLSCRIARSANGEPMQFKRHPDGSATLETPQGSFNLTDTGTRRLGACRADQHHGNVSTAERHAG